MWSRPSQTGVGPVVRVVVVLPPVPVVLLPVPVVLVAPPERMS